MTNRIVRRSGVVVALALLLGACGSSAGEGTATDEAVASDALTLEEMQDTPLATLMGFGAGADDAADMQREVEQIVAECMAAQGFEYVPETVEDEFFVDPYSEIDEVPGTRAFAEMWGYGISTLTDFDGVTDEAFEEDAVAVPDPTDGMSDGERDAYYAALYGDFEEFDSSLTVEEQDALLENYEPSGCQNEAFEQVYSGGLFADSEFESLIIDLYDRIQADPRIVEAQSAWSECMAGKGYSFTSVDDTYSAVSERMNELYEEAGDPFEGFTDEDFAAMSEEELRALSSGPRYDEELLAEINAYEIDIAVADYDCGIDTRRTFYDVQVELETQFIAENKDMIDSLQGATG